MGLLRRLLKAVLEDDTAPLDPMPLRHLIERRDALWALQLAHVRSGYRQDRYLHEHRVDWLRDRDVLTARGYDTSGVVLPDIEETWRYLERAEAAVDVEVLLTRKSLN